MKKIICPTDFSETAQHAVTYAAKMAQKCGAELTLFHVQSLWDLIPVELVWGKDMTHQAIANHIEELSLEITRVYKISCKGVIQKSNQSVSKLIANESNHQYDLIIMGTEGPNSLYEFFAGSKTYQVTKKAQVPILLLPPNIEFQEISSIVYAADYFHEQDLPLNQLVSWATILQSKITVLQIITEPFKQEIEETLTQRQLHFQQKGNNQFDLDFITIYSGHVIDGINYYLLKKSCDLLAVNTRHHNFLKKLFHESIIKIISASPQLPTFVFHQ